MSEQQICVYCSSSNAVGPEYFAAAKDLGRAIARRGYTLVYGGTRVGLMGAIADSAREMGGPVVGIIPETLHLQGISHPDLTELIVTKGLRGRKALMEERAGAFIGLPGGFGTLEEIFECITLKQLGYHNKPIALLNVAEFYQPFIQMMEHIYESKFAKPIYRELYRVIANTDDLFNYLDGYRPPDVISKWP